jgi:hypothetical protein
VQAIPEPQRVALGRWDALLRHLTDPAAGYRQGDILVIHGWTPWDERERHFHSVFVYESDPFTGAPIWLAGNAGTPSLRPWWTEATRTPKRSIVARIRPRLEWLESVVRPARAPADEIAPLVGSR